MNVRRRVQRGDDKVQICFQVDLYTPDGEPLSITDVYARAEDPEDLSDLRVTFEVTPMQWERIAEERLFHVQDLERVAALDMSEHPTVEVEVRLEKTLLDQVSGRAGDLKGLVAEFNAAQDRDAALLQTESWVATQLAPPKAEDDEGVSLR